MIDDPDELDELRALLAATPLTDGHNDLLWELRDRWDHDLSRVDLAAGEPSLHTDLPRLRAGGVGAQFWSVYTPSDLPPHAAVTATLEQLDAWSHLVTAYPAELAPARTADDVERAAREGRIASLAGMEGGQSIGCSLGALRAMYRLGARYLTLTHNRNTPWADSATDEPEHGGLTGFGREVVAEMNRLGMLVDLSHVAPTTMRDALAVSEAPVIFSHSAARALVDHPRNVPDDVLAAAARAGGVCMVTFAPGFVSPAVAAAWLELLAAERTWRAEFPDDPERVRVLAAAWIADHPYPPAALEQVADHVDHVREAAGIDHVGIGGDFDGVTELPIGLEDVSAYPRLFAALRRRGYSDADLRKVAGRNVLRVLRAAEDIARDLQARRVPSLTRFTPAPPAPGPHREG
jgi:membrane dipeptidase